MQDWSKAFFDGKWRGSPETVCGWGSSLAYTEHLRAALAAIFPRIGVRTFVDAPCGDFHYMSEVDLTGIRYIGLDVVPETVERARLKGLDHEFHVGDVTTGPLPDGADLFMTRDCLFHLTFAHIAGWLDVILAARPRWVLVTSNPANANADLAEAGGYRPLNLLKPPFQFPAPPPGDVVRDYPDGAPVRHMLLYPLSMFEEHAPGAISRLRNWTGPVKGLQPVAAAVPVTAVAGGAGRNNAASRQAGAALDVPPQAATPIWAIPAGVPTEATHPFLAQYRAMAANPFVLDYLVELSRRTISFFSRHAPRAYEYPEVLQRVLATRGDVADLGAGVSPIPFALAARGRRVVTVDNSNIRRNPANRADWNEWGFLDYGLIDPAIRSVNKMFHEAGIAPQSLGCVYSVSVIEHMPAELRRGLWRDVGASLGAGGHLVMSLDLVARTDKLWNRVLGKVVEQEELHGTMSDIIAELSVAGMAVQDLTIERGLPGSVTDIAVVTAVKR